MKLIITADDYSVVDCIDSGIEKVISEGCINCVSAFVNGPDSLIKIKNLHTKFPELPIGIHLTITSGKPVSEPEHVGTLIKHNANNCFMDIDEFDYFRVNLMELEHELEKQIQKFLSSGIEMDHITGHQEILNLFEDF